MGLFGKGPSLWQRMADGLALAELWSRFKSDTHASYGLYAKYMDSESFRRQPGWSKAGKVAIALFWQLSAPRRIALVLALLVVLDGAHKSDEAQTVAGSLLLLFLLGLELADRLTMKRDIEIAREIQGWLVPKIPPRIQALDIAFITRPANTVSGDYYDTFLRPGRDGSSTGQHLLIVVADVAGKSVPAALLMATFQASLRCLAADELPLPELILRLNRYASAHSFGGLRFTTAFIGELELDTRILTYVNAGHNAPVLVRTDGDLERFVTGGVPLGIDPVALYQLGQVLLHSGDRLVIFSDGVVESQNRRGEEYGEERLLGLVRATAGLSAQEELNRILESVDGFVGSAPRYDDTTLLILHLVDRN